MNVWRAIVAVATVLPAGSSAVGVPGDLAPDDGAAPTVVEVPFAGAVTEELPEGWRVTQCPAGAPPNLVGVTCDGATVTFAAQEYDPGQDPQDVQIAAQFRGTEQVVVYRVALGAPEVHAPPDALYGYPLAQGAGATIPYAELVAHCEACTTTLPTYTGARIEPADAGSVAFTGLGLVVRPSPTFAGEATVTFLVRDVHGRESEPTALTVHVVPGGASAPVGVAQQVRIDVGREATGDVLAEVPGREDADLIVASCGPALNGEVTCEPDGSFAYVPRDGFTGVDQFAFHVTATDGDHAVGSVVIGVGVDPVGAMDVRAQPEVTPVLAPRAPSTASDEADAAGVFPVLRDALASVHGDG